MPRCSASPAPPASSRARRCRAPAERCSVSRSSSCSASAGVVRPRRSRLGGRPVRARHRGPGHRPARRQARPAPGGPAVRRVLDRLRRHRRGAVVDRRPGLDPLRLLRPERRAARARPDVAGPLGAHLPRRARAGCTPRCRSSRSADEASFVIGPVLAVLVSTLWFPEAGLLLAELLFTDGHARVPRRSRHRAAGRAARRPPGRLRRSSPRPARRRGRARHDRRHLRRQRGHRRRLRHRAAARPASRASSSGPSRSARPWPASCSAARCSG